jgi:hypothetical protein
MEGENTEVFDMTGTKKIGKYFVGIKRPIGNWTSFSVFVADEKTRKIIVQTPYVSKEQATEVYKSLKTVVNVEELIRYYS